MKTITLIVNSIKNENILMVIIAVMIIVTIIMIVISKICTLREKHPYLEFF